MYTWGYIRNVTLAKLDIDEREANEQNLLERFPYYANEAITQICSAVKPKKTFVQFLVGYKDVVWNELRQLYKVYPDYKTPINKPDKLTDEEKSFWTNYESYTFCNDLVKMPEDFISFGDDVNTIEGQDFMYNTYIRQCYDVDMLFRGYNNLMFFRPGKYTISYNARWCTFSNNTSLTETLDVPTDILDCLPSYIAHQCYKIDDEVKSSIFRNEYEMFLSRIDDTDFKQTKTFTIGGDW